jgi:hypothetical protein
VSPFRTPRALRLAATLAVVLLVALAGVPDLSARAGGAGGHSSGGSHGSGGSRSSGGSGFHSGSSSSGAGASTPLTPGGVAIVVIIIVVAIAFVVIRGRLARRGLLPGAEDGDEVTEDEPEGPVVDAESIAAFVAANPGFDVPAFKQKVRRGFTKIQAAWTAQQLASVRAFISDGMYQRFATQFVMMKLLRQTNVLDNVRLTSVALACSWQDGAFDVVEVYVEASMRDAFVCELDHSLDMAGESAFAEYWSFIRKQKAPDPRGDIYDATTCPPARRRCRRTWARSAPAPIATRWSTAATTTGSSPRSPSRRTTARAPSWARSRRARCRRPWRSCSGRFRSSRCS